MDKEIFGMYSVMNTEGVSGEVIERAMHKLPAARVERARHYLFAKDKHQCVLSYLLLTHAIKEVFSVDVSGLDFDTGEYGKPYFRHFPDIHFNISHCVDGCVCIVSSTECGADIQNLRDISDSLLEATLCDSELKWINTVSRERESRFMRLWVMKESYAKYIGKGLGIDFKTLDFSCPTDIFRYDGCIIRSTLIGGCSVSFCAAADMGDNLITVCVDDLL